MNSILLPVTASQPVSAEYPMQFSSTKPVSAGWRSSATLPSTILNARHVSRHHEQRVRRRIAGARHAVPLRHTERILWTPVGATHASPLLPAGGTPENAVAPDLAVCHP
ncbi:MAG: hypothetical protein WHS83_19105 [Chloroflexus sp.]|uniref:hypothetical protein n=1 Tax=Chloroflexus sp. TaxID=1904827 RepID=UPI00309D92E0